MPSRMTTKIALLAETPPWEWPGDSRTTLLAALEDRGLAATDRLCAAELAGDLLVMADEVAAALLRILQEPSEAVEIRGQAAISLGPVLEEMDEDPLDEDDEPSISQATFKRIQETLHRLALDPGIPTDVRRRVLEASVRAQAEWHQEAIRSALASGEEAWKLTAVFCMQFVPGFDEEIVAALGSADPEVHLEAVRAAGAWGVEDAWPHILALLTAGETPKELLLEAIDAAVYVNQDDALVYLQDLTGSDDEEVASAAFEALEMAGSELGMDIDDDWDEDDEDDDEEEDNTLR